jgi:prevent-host-death family protein
VDAITLADAKAHLSELVDRVEAGDSIDIARRGKRVVRLTAVATPRKQINGIMLQALTAAMAPQTQEAADLVRQDALTRAADWVASSGYNRACRPPAGTTRPGQSHA